MSISELWPLQGSTKNKLLIGHLWKSDIVGTNLQVELDCLQLQAGVSWDVLSREGTMIQKYVEKCWTSHLWEPARKDCEEHNAAVSSFKLWH
jgi:hypothetical protein